MTYSHLRADCLYIGISSGPTLDNEYGKPLPVYSTLQVIVLVSDARSVCVLDIVFVYTGLYAETSGMIDNYMFDPEHKEYFLIGNNPEQYHSYWWKDGEPLWITAAKQVRRHREFCLVNP